MFEGQDQAALLGHISREFPDLKWSNSRLITEGWDHAVIILDDAVVFRFPLDSEYQEKLVDEVRFLENTRARLVINVPQYEFIASDQSFAGYNIVPGVALERDVMADLSLEDRDEVATQLGAFLTAMHSCDPSEYGPDIEPFYVAEEQAEIRRCLIEDVQPLLSEHDFSIAMSMLDEVDEVLKSAPGGTLLHADVYGRHLLWDADQDQLGIIDFSDMCVGDPALDFAEIHEYGFEFVNRVYSHYQGPKDPGFLERAWVYEKWMAVYMLTDQVTYEKITFEVARDTFDHIRTLG